MGLMCNSNLRFIRAEKGDKVEIFMTHIIMIEKIIKIGIDQIVEMGKFNLVHKVEVDQDINKIRREEILEAMQDDIKNVEDRITEENMGVIIGLKIIAEKEIGVV